MSNRISLLTSKIEDLRCSSIITNLLKLKGSTTHFLNTFIGKPIQVKIGQQEKVITQGIIKIYRESWLYSIDPVLPLLYCISYLEPMRLSRREYKNISNDTIPLGKILDRNDSGKLHKTNIKVCSSKEQLMAEKLSTCCEICYKKSYDLLINGINFGHILEVMNEESISRLFHQDSIG